MTPLVPGVATGVGSLPHTDPGAAARLSLDSHPRLPAVPQLPRRDPAEGMLAQWLGILSEVEVGPDGSVTIGDGDQGAQPEPRFDADTHGGLLAFLEVARAAPLAAVKVQVTGPLTLGLGLAGAGLPANRAFARASDAASAWARALVALVAEHLPDADVVLFLDEPGLVAWRDADGPLSREEAVDLLSGVLAGIRLPAGVHVCGAGDRRLAIEAGPDIVGFEPTPDVLADALAIARFLEGGGWVAWGAIPTDRPVGDSAEHWWERLVSLWCDLTRAGCDPRRLRTQALVTPACGLAHHDEEQAERILRLAVQVGERIREQATAVRLSVGA